MRLLVLLILLTSCASRKVSVVKEQTSKDSVYTSVVDSVSVVKNNIFYTENSQELEIRPIVDSVPIVVNGVSYKNAVLKYRKYQKAFKDTSIKRVDKKTNNKIAVKQTKRYKAKSIDKKASYWWLLIIPIGIIIYRRIKNKLLL